MPLKRALLQRHGLAANFSCSHAGYHSAVGYGVLPSRKKPQAALDPQPLAWAATGNHPHLFDAAQEPTTSAALQRRMERRSKAAGEVGKKARYSELDVWPLVVRNGIRDCDEGEAGYLRLIKVAKETCPHACVDFLFKLRKKLPSLIDDVWSWENVDDLLMASSFTRTDALHGAMRQPCVCGGEWPRLVAQSMVANQLDPADVGHDMYTALVAGRKDTTPVVVLAGKAGGEGKSLLLYPLSTIFGEDAAPCSPEKGSFPLLGLEKKKVVVLDDWRFNGRVLPLMCSYCGSRVSPCPWCARKAKMSSLGM